MIYEHQCRVGYRNNDIRHPVLELSASILQICRWQVFSEINKSLDKGVFEGLSLIYVCRDVRRYENLGGGASILNSRNVVGRICPPG